MISEEELARLSYPDAPKVITKIPGPIAQGLLDESDRYDTPTGADRTAPIVWDQGLGATVKDVDGNIFIDLTSGVAVSSVGRLHPKVVEVIKEQSAKLMHSIFINPMSVELAKKLSNVMPEGLRDQCFICYTLSGSTAIEVAIKYARAITGKKNFIAFQGAYHGVWQGSLALTTSTLARSGYGPLMSGVFHAPYGYCYRCFAHLEYPNCGLECAKYFDHLLNAPGTGVDDVAAVIAEPIQGEGGYIAPPPEFFRMIKAACDKKGTLFIADEVQSGAGRTGKMWAIEHYGVVPDMLVFGKGVGGDQPLAGVAVSAGFRDKLPAGSQPITFSRNALSCAVALANIDILTDSDADLIGRARKLGEEIKNKFVEAAKDSKVIGEVRGKGLMISVELVKNKETREPVSKLPDILKKCWDQGIIVFPCGPRRNVLRLMPPLTISRAQLNKAIDVLLDLLREGEDDLAR